MFRRLHERLDEIQDRLGLIDRTLLVREPGTPRAADAYEGLRRQVIAAAQERRAHLADLAQIDAAMAAGESVDDLRLLLQDLMAGVGLTRIADPALTDAYEVVGGEGEALEVIAPCYVDTATSQLVRQGRARAAQAASAEEPTHDGATAEEAAP